MAQQWKTQLVPNFTTGGIVVQKGRGVQRKLWNCNSERFVVYMVIVFLLIAHFDVCLAH